MELGISSQILGIEYCLPIEISSHHANLILAPTCMCSRATNW